MKKTTLFYLGAALLIILIHYNYALLRAMRNTLVVTGVEGSASLIPTYELFGTLPGTLILAALLSYLLKRFSLRTVFLLTAASFTLFFGTYGTLFESRILFFALAELWKVALFYVLLFGFLNQIMEMGAAKKAYAPLLFGISIGLFLASPTIDFCNAYNWEKTFFLQQMVIVVVGLLIMLLFFFLSRGKNLSIPTDEKKEPLLETITTFLRSPVLRSIGLIVFIDYVVYKPFEVIYFDSLKRQFPTPELFYQFQGDLSYWTAILTVVSSLVIAPFCFSRFSWFVNAAIPPLLLTLLVLTFYHATYYEYSFAYLLGACQYCLGHAIKYAFQNPSKELAFMPLPAQEKMQGKIVIDGFLGRSGYGVSSFITISLMEFFGSVAGIVGVAAGLHALLYILWLRATYRVSQPPPKALINCTVET